MLLRCLLLLALLLPLAGCGDAMPDPVPAPTAARDAEGRLELGYTMVGRNGVRVFSLEALEPGSTSHWEILLYGLEVTSVRAGLGPAEGGEPPWHALEGERGTYGATLEVPAALGTGWALWVEVVDLEGVRSTQAFRLP